MGEGGTDGRTAAGGELPHCRPHRVAHAVVSLHPPIVGGGGTEMVDGGGCLCGGALRKQGGKTAAGAHLVAVAVDVG